MVWYDMIMWDIELIRGEQSRGEWEKGVEWWNKRGEVEYINDRRDGQNVVR